MKNQLMCEENGLLKALSLNCMDIFNDERKLIVLLTKSSLPYFNL